MVQNLLNEGKSFGEEHEGNMKNIKEQYEKKIENLIEEVQRLHQVISSHDKQLEIARAREKELIEEIQRIQKEGNQKEQKKS